MQVYLFDGDKKRCRDGMSLEDMEKSDDLLASTEVDLELLKGDNRVKDYPITFSAKRNRFAQNMCLNFSTQLLSVTGKPVIVNLGSRMDDSWSVFVFRVLQ